MTNLIELYNFWFSNECKPYYFNQSNLLYFWFLRLKNELIDQRIFQNKL